MPRLDRRTLRIFPLAERTNALDIRKIAIAPGTPPPVLLQRVAVQVAQLAAHIRVARAAGHPVMLTFGAHLIKNGLGPIIIRLMEKGWITHLATNGAGSIHDWEFAYQGCSSEDVRANVAQGQFGTWEETGRYLNLAVAVGGLAGLGYGASVGQMIQDEGLDVPTREVLYAHLICLAAQAAPDETLGAQADLLSLITNFDIPPGPMAIPHPFKPASVQAAAARLQIPFTVHPGIGYDIIYTHPLNSGGAIGRGAVRDFLTYADSVSRLEGGVHITIGSAIMAPMVFEKSLSMANNLAIQRGERIENFHLVVNDIQAGGEWNWSQGEPPKDHPAYYLRFCKTFVRMGGELDYIQLDNRAFLTALYAFLRGKVKK